MWTYNICAADTDTYCDYYDKSTMTSTKRDPPSNYWNKYFMLLCHKGVNDGLGIKSTSRLKTFMQ